MAISFVGSAKGAGSATLPSHVAGDLIVGFAYGEGNALGLPAGYTSVRTFSDSSPTQRTRLFYKFAESSSEAFSVVNAESVVAHVYRHSGNLLIGPNQSLSFDGTGVDWGGLTLSGGESWVVGFAYHTNTDGDLIAGPAGMVNRQSSLTPVSTASHDTDGTVSSWPTTSYDIGGSSGRWRTFVLEITEIPLILGLTAQETTQDTFSATMDVGGTFTITSQETTQDSFSSFIFGLEFTVSVQGIFVSEEEVLGNWNVEREVNTIWRRANVN